MTIVDPSTTVVEPFDFRRPPLMPRERRAILDGAHDAIRPRLERVLTGALRTPVTVTLDDTAQVAFGDFRRGLGSPVTSFVMPLSAREGGDGLIYLESPFALTLIDILLGGSGEIGGRSAPPTPLEQQVLGQLMSDWVHAVQAGYAEIAPFTPGPLRFESVVESLEIVPRHERVWLIRCGLTAEERSGEITLLLPAPCIEAFARGEKKGDQITPMPPAELQRLLEMHLRAATVPTAVRLTGFQLTARDSATLAAGQVLESNYAFQGTVELHLNGRPRFLGALGRQHGHVGLRILDRLESAAIPPRLLRRTTPS